MKPKVKIITPWYGPLPKFYEQFKERFRANTLFEHQIIPISGAREINRRAEVVSGVQCHKSSVYAACCDLKPLFGEMFAGYFDGYEWWGRCDLDVVVGDLDGLLGPVLDAYDGYSAEFYVLSGALTMFRNCQRTRTLWRDAEWKAMLENPHYTHFDHAGLVQPLHPTVEMQLDRFSEEAKNPDLYGNWRRTQDVSITSSGGFTGVVARSGIRMLWDDRSWDEGRTMLPDGRPSRVPHLIGRKLIEMPTGREIAVYSIGSAKWPLFDPKRTPKVLENTLTVVNKAARFSRVVDMSIRRKR